MNAQAELNVVISNTGDARVPFLATVAAAIGFLGFACILFA
jgi:hypothetical protein